MSRTKPAKLKQLVEHNPVNPPKPFSSIVRPRTPNQIVLLDAMKKNEITIAIGPAGTGKTKLSVAMAVKELKDGKVKKIILTRPVIEAEEKIGFLPGGPEAKLHPYLIPLFDFLGDHYTQEELKKLLAPPNPIIEIAPLGFCRGRNFEDCVVVCDEMQNSTLTQLILMTTRLCNNCKIIINGDPTQIDLHPAYRSGLEYFAKNYGDLEGLSVVKLDKSDIVRHPVVSRIVNRREQLKEEESGN